MSASSPSAVSTVGAVTLQRAFVPLSVFHGVTEENKTLRKEVKRLTDKNAERGLTILEKVNLITQLEPYHTKWYSSGILGT